MHKTAHQLLVCASGRVDVVVEHAERREVFQLDKPGKALHLCPLVWSEQVYVSADALLLVLSSERYDPDSYSHSHTASKT